MASTDESLLSTFDELVSQTDLSVSQQQRENLIAYVQLLDKWNKTYNLTSVRSAEEMLVKHLLDSLSISTFINKNNILDVGTGPGLPGIPLAIMHPDKAFTLLDSLGKRVRFLKQTVFELGVSNVNAVQSRVEEFSPQHRFDVILSRAFASLHDMLTWCEHLIAKDGQFFALKGQLHDEELENIPPGFSIVETKRLFVPTLASERHLIIIIKN